MGFIKIPYEGQEDIEVRAIGSLVNFLVDEQNYTLIEDDEWKEENFWLNVDVFKKMGDKYVQVDLYEYRKNPYLNYYRIKGTAEFSCPACSGDGLITGDDGIEYTCPRCNGAEKLYRTTDGVPIKTVSVIQRKPTSDGYEIRYSVVPPGSFASKTIKESEVLKDENENEEETSSPEESEEE